MAKSFAGTHETYTFSENDGVTSLRVDLDSDDDNAAMFVEMWPLALDALREIAEEAEKSDEAHSPGGPEGSFTLIRDLDAPPAQVFAAWTEPNKLGWFANPYNPTDDPIEVDLRVGGAWRQTMVIDEQNRYVTGGIYREIVPGARLVFAWGAVDGWPEIDPHDLDAAATATVIFDESTSGTSLRFRLDLPENPDPSLLGHPKRDGWTQTIDRLVERFARSSRHTGA
jgi:uncharacterized protein YndB with AHSA1/START domain